MIKVVQGNLLDAQAIARKVTWGNYLINRPLDIVAHCKSLVKGGTGCDA